MRESGAIVSVKFEVGDRVRVYGALGAGSSFCGKIVAVGPTGKLVTVQSGTTEMNVCPQQCRRLKPKPKPKPEKKEARRVWVHPNGIVELDNMTATSIYVTKNDRTKNTSWVPFRECLPNEVVVTRETLAKAYRDAWSQIPLNEDTSNETMISLIAKALGLEGKP